MLVPYPNAAMNSWKQGDATIDKFVCVQSVFVDHMGRLWVLDPAAAFLGNLTGSAKLFQIDLSTDKVIKTYELPSNVAPAHSYVNDVRITADGKHAILTDSTVGGLNVLDLETGKARKVLATHPSTHAEADVITTVEGQKMYLAGTHPPVPATFQSDGIAILGPHVYYHAVTARTLYRIEAAVLTDPAKTEQQLAAAVEVVTTSGIHDGMVVAADRTLSKGLLLFTAIEKDGIDYLSVDGQNRVLPLVSDERLQWPDSMSVPVVQPGPGKSHYLYVTASQVQYSAFIANPKPRRNEYGLYRVRLPDTLLDPVIQSTAPNNKTLEEPTGKSKLAGSWLFHASDAPNTTLHLDLDATTGRGRVTVPPNSAVILTLENGTFVYDSTWIGNWAEGSKAHGSVMVTSSPDGAAFEAMWTVSGAAEAWGKQAFGKWLGKRAGD